MRGERREKCKIIFLFHLFLFFRFPPYIYLFLDNNNNNNNKITKLTWPNSLGNISIKTLNVGVKGDTPLYFRHYVTGRRLFAPSQNPMLVFCVIWNHSETYQSLKGSLGRRLSEISENICYANCFDMYTYAILLQILIYILITGCTINGTSPTENFNPLSIHKK